MRKNTLCLFCIAACFTAFIACRQQQAAMPVRPANTFVVKGSLREMTINPETPEFPEAPGKTEFTQYCGICHSLRYISTQPNFPEKTWEAEVHKMVVKYNAPVDSITGQKIIAYLSKVKGTND